MPEAALVVQINIRDEGDHFYAASPDVPGLHVCGLDLPETKKRAAAALQRLFKLNRGLDVVVSQLSDDVEGYPETFSTDGRFVVQRRQAECMAA